MKLLFSTCIALSLFAAEKTHYVNKTFRISLSYSNAFKLKEGDLGENDSLGYMGPIPMEFSSAGGERVVTVTIPADTFPGTDFNTAFVTVSVHRHLRSEDCLLFPADISGTRNAVQRKIGRILFHGLEQGEAAMSHYLGGTYYHAFQSGTCYEIGEGIATSGYGAVDGLKEVNEKTVFALLDSIVDSIVIRTH